MVSVKPSWLSLVLLLGGCDPWTIENSVHPPPVEPQTPTPGEPQPEEDTLEMPGASTVPIDARCRDTCDRSHPAWQVEREWEGVIAPNMGQSTTTPTVAHLDDEDGDGVIGSKGDLPEILVGANHYGEVYASPLSAWRGDGAVSRLYDAQIHRNITNVSVADVDGDDLPEIVSVTGDYGASQVTVLEVDGRVLWSSETFSLSNGAGTYIGACNPVVTDLEGDGRVEIFCDVLLLDGPTGQTLWKQPFELDTYWVIPTVADLDLDGVSEIVSGNEIFRSDGTLWWELDTQDSIVAYPAVAQLDEDPAGELLIATGGAMVARDTDGAPLWRTDVGGGTEAASPPCLADFDGDGAIEIAAAFSTQLAVFETDGTLVWTRPINDGSTAAGCSAVDLDLDGRAEIAYADENTFGLYCGVDGSVLFQDPDHSSGTLTEFPVIADVDGDGSAEIVVSYNTFLLPDQGSGFVVYGAPGWPSAGDSFPQPDFRTGTQEGMHPTGQTATWLTDGLVRAQPTLDPLVPRPLLPDLGLVVADQAGDCSGFSLAVQIENRGPGDAEAGRVLEVLAVDSSVLGEQVSRPVASLTLPAVPSGTRSAALRLDLAPHQLGRVGVLLVIPDVAGIPECDPTNQDVLVPLRCE